MMLKNKPYFAKIFSEYQKITKKLHDPKVISDLDQYTKFNSQLKKLTPTALVYEKYLQLEHNLFDLNELLTKEPELAVEVTAEIKNLKLKMATQITKLDEIFAQKNQIKPFNFAILEIRGAVGGKEANLFVADLKTMYCNYFKAKHWKYELWEANQSEGGGYSLLIILIKNSEAFYWLQYEAGVHRVQRIPKTESSGRVHTSTATVAVLEEKTMTDVEISPKDLRIDTFRSSGAGGQHVNTTDSAVRVTHLPTGMIVSCQDGRSQHDNKDKALRVLRARLFKLQKNQFQSMNTELRNTQIGEGERSEKIRTYNFPQNRITDHRIGLTLKNIDQVFSGKLDNLLIPLADHFKND